MLAAAAASGSRAREGGGATRAKPRNANAPGIVV
jgi:hypothetical protein